MSDRAASQERPRPDVIAALNRLDEVAPTLWQQQPKGHPMAPMQIPIREWVATIRAGLASQERPQPALDGTQPPWDHPYESADQSMACRHCGWVGSYAHTAEFYQKWVFPALSGVQERPLLGTYERETLAEHRDDGNGGCLVCRIWKPGEYDDDGESELLSMMSWPCPTVRLARAQERPLIDVERFRRSDRAHTIYHRRTNPAHPVSECSDWIAAEYDRLSGSVGE